MVRGMVLSLFLFRRLFLTAPVAGGAGADGFCFPPTLPLAGAVLAGLVKVFFRGGLFFQTLLSVKHSQPQRSQLSRAMASQSAHNSMLIR